MWLSIGSLIFICITKVIMTAICWQKSWTPLIMKANKFVGKPLWRQHIASLHDYVSSSELG